MEEKLKYLWDIRENAYVEEDGKDINDFEEFIKLLNENRTILINVNGELHFKLTKRSDGDVDVEKNDYYCWHLCTDVYRLSEMNLKDIKN
jgi:hypothetical protein